MKSVLPFWSYSVGVKTMNAAAARTAVTSRPISLPVRSYINVQLAANSLPPLSAPSSRVAMYHCTNGSGRYFSIPRSRKASAPSSSPSISRSPKRPPGSCFSGYGMVWRCLATLGYCLALLRLTKPTLAAKKRTNTPINAKRVHKAVAACIPKRQLSACWNAKATYAY